MGPKLSLGPVKSGQSMDFCLAELVKVVPSCPKKSSPLPLAKGTHDSTDGYCGYVADPRLASRLPWPLFTSACCDFQSPQQPPQASVFFITVRFILLLAVITVLFLALSVPLAILPFSQMALVMSILFLWMCCLFYAQ